MPKSASAKRRPLGRRGISAVEFAIVAGLFFLAMLAVMDMARYYVTMHSMRNVVAQAGRALMINPALGSTTRTCNDASLVASAGGLGFVSSTGNLCVTRSQATTSAGVAITGMTEVFLELDAPFTFIIPVFGLTTVTIVERQRFRFAT
ncbi:TadE/TadG family type IV pilus assembly protein [Roseomonas sp. CAU 1739]|uniref:TadE/TadG family type IV pilus assembly protein n=1 Tax=Roseomonas sp. CAU 1739 TaxID=3140364 RepID=UPI00325B14AC